MTETANDGDSVTEKPTAGFRTWRSLRRWLGASLPRNVMLLSALTAASLSGCAPYAAVDLADRPAHSYPGFRSDAGTAVAARVFSDRETVARFFDGELWDAGFFPVIVHIENRGREGTEILQSECSLWTRADVEAGRGRPPVGLAAVLPEALRSDAPAYALFPLLVVPGIIAYRSIRAYNANLSRDWSAKAFPAKLRLEPGDGPVHGALFFRQPVDEENLAVALRNAEIRVRIRIEGSRVNELSGAEDARVGDVVEWTIPLIEADE